MRNRTYGGVRGRKVSLPCGKLTFLLLDCHRLAVIRKKIFHLEQPQASGTREAQMKRCAAPYPREVSRPANEQYENRSRLLRYHYKQEPLRM